MSITLDEVRAEALFAGDLQPSEHPPAERVRESVTAILRRYGSQWCAARMAQEFGDHPEAAAARMVWALRVVQDCYPRHGGRAIRCGLGRVRQRPLTVLTVKIDINRCRYPLGRYRQSAQRGDRWC
jgi:hypothetical protein